MTLEGRNHLVLVTGSLGDINDTLDVTSPSLLTVIKHNLTEVSHHNLSSMELVELKFLKRTDLLMLILYTGIINTGIRPQLEEQELRRLQQHLFSNAWDSYDGTRKSQEKPSRKYKP